MKPLSGKQRRYLRTLGHGLEPVVRVGKGGVTDGIVSAVSEALEAHEIIKVKVLAESPVGRKELVGQLAERCDAHGVQVLGRSIMLYRAHPTAPRIVLPRSESVPEMPA